MTPSPASVYPTLRVRTTDHPDCLAAALKCGGTIIITGDLPKWSVKPCELIIEQLIELGVAYRHQGAVMLRMPSVGVTSFVDAQRGVVSADNAAGVCALATHTGCPTRVLVDTVSSHELKIDRIIRPADRLDEAAAETYIRLVLGWPQPTYHHVGKTVAEAKADANFEDALASGKPFVVIKEGEKLRDDEIARQFLATGKEPFWFADGSLGVKFADGSIIAV